VLGLDDQIGSVSVDKRADLVVLRRNTTADRVRDVIVEGVFLTRRGTANRRHLPIGYWPSTHRQPSLISLP